MMTKKQAKKWLPIVRELREYYEGKNDKHSGVDCVLCIKSKVEDDSHCCRCPWCLIDGVNCVGYFAENFKSSNFFTPIYDRRTRTTFWTKDSIKRLKRWEKLMEDKIDKKT